MDVDIADGERLPAFSSLAFEDGVSLDVSTHEQQLWVSGRGSCTVRATSEWGTSSEATLDADVEVPRFQVDQTRFSSERLSCKQVRSDAGLDVVRFSDDAPYCVSIHPLAEDGLRIVGAAPEPARVRGTRGVLVVTATDAERASTCFRRHHPGDVDLTWSWGSAEKSVTWTVE